MLIMRQKILWGSAVLFIAIAVATGVYFTLSTFAHPSLKPILPVFNRDENFKVQSNTSVRQEIEYLCQDVQITYWGPPPKEILGLGLTALKEKYPPDEFWEVEATGNLLVLRQKQNKFCSEHQNYRHLGLRKDNLAVYEGPLGYNHKLLRVEDKIPVNALPLDYQLKLNQAMDFNRQPPEIQGSLQKELEFSSDLALQSALENLDELYSGREGI
jgi:hypothetical protein